MFTYYVAGRAPSLTSLTPPYVDVAATAPGPVVTVRGANFCADFRSAVRLRRPPRHRRDLRLERRGALRGPSALRLLSHRARPSRRFHLVGRRAPPHPAQLLAARACLRRRAARAARRRTRRRRSFWDQLLPGGSLTAAVCLRSAAARVGHRHRRRHRRCGHDDVDGGDVRLGVSPPLRRSRRRSARGRRRLLRRRVTRLRRCHRRCSDVLRSIGTAGSIPSNLRMRKSTRRPASSSTARTLRRRRAARRCSAGLDQWRRSPPVSSPGGRSRATVRATPRPQSSSWRYHATEGTTGSRAMLP